MMVSKIFKHLLQEINSTLDDKVGGKHIKLDIANTADIANQTLQLEADDNQTSFYTTQTQTDVYQILSTTLISSDADNSTQSTMTRNVVSAFTINSADVFDKPHHNIMVAILLGIFTCISITITISIFVFCRKKNSVFMLQKCEQDSDIDLEMNDMNTEAETSDSEYEFIESTSPEHSNRRSQTCPNLSEYTNEESTKEENRQVNFDKYSNSRRSLNRNKHQSSGSPTSTPLLNSTFENSVNIGKVELNHHSKFSSHSLSLNFKNQSGAYAAETSGRQLNQSSKGRKDKKLNQSRNETEKYNSHESTTKTKTEKSRHKSKTQYHNPHKVQNSEHGFFEIKVTNSSLKAKRKHQKCVQENNEPCKKQTHVDSSILRMESIKDSSADFTDGVLHDEIHEIQDLKGKLEIL